MGVCGKKFAQSAYVKQHLRYVHKVGDVTSFQCDVCTKIFKEKGTLKDTYPMFTANDVTSKTLCAMIAPVSFDSNILKRD